MRQVTDGIYLAVLNRMNITWEPDLKAADNIRTAIEEAQDYLCRLAGSPDVDFTVPDRRNLLITCSWYFVENKRADFEREYSGELLCLRLEEAFHCGKDAADNPL